MKLNSNFIVHDTESGTLLVPVGGSGFAGLVRGNATLGEILSLLQSDISLDGLLAAMKSKFDAPEDVLARDIDKALAELRGIGALDE